MTEYLLGAKRAADALAAAGDPITDKALVGYITDGLGVEFQSFLSMMSMHPPHTFDELYSLLLNEEFLQNRLRPKPTETGAALYANRQHSRSTNYRRGGGRGRSGRSNPHTSSYGSGYGSSYAIDNAVNKNRKSNQSNAGWNMRHSSHNSHGRTAPSHQPPILQIPATLNDQGSCQWCGQVGHTARFCPQQRNYAYAASLPTQFNSMTVAEPAQHDWILDSGASHHMTPTESNLSNVSGTSGQTDRESSIYWPQP